MHSNGAVLLRQSLETSVIQCECCFCAENLGEDHYPWPAASLHLALGLLLVQRRIQHLATKLPRIVEFSANYENEAHKWSRLKMLVLFQMFQ